MKTIVTDRGYAWVVLFAAFVSNIVTTGTYSATGVLFVEYLEYYDQSRSITSIITAVFGATRGLAGLVAGGLIHKYGSRPVGMVGALFGTLGYGLSAFAPSVYYLCVTQGVLLGVANACVIVSSLVVTQQYFDRRRSLATSLSALGHSVGAIAFAPLCQYLIEQYGWRGATVILSGIYLHVLPVQALVMPLATLQKEGRKCSREKHGDQISDLSSSEDSLHLVPTANLSPKGSQYSTTSTGLFGSDEHHEKMSKYERERSNIDNLRLDKTRRCTKLCLKLCTFLFHPSLISSSIFWLYSINKFSSFFLRITPGMLLPARVLSHNINKESAVMLVSVIGFVALPMRLMSGFIGDLRCLNRLLYYGICSIASGIVLTITVFMHTYVHFLIYSILAGVLTGLTFSVENPLAVDLLGLENLPKTFGFCSLVSAVGFLVLVPGMGWVADMTGSFAIPFACEGIMHTLFAASFVIFVPLLQRR